MHPSVHAAGDPTKPAYIMARSGEIVTYGQLEARSNQGAHLFRSLGLARGDGVALMLENDARFFEIVWAAHRAGLYFTCISTRLASAEIAYIVADSGSTVLIGSAAVSPDIAAAVDDLVVFAPGARDFVAERSAFPTDPVPDESPGTDMLYSSGTTGRPKGIRPPLPEGELNETNTLTEFGRTSFAMSADTIFLILS